MSGNSETQTSTLVFRKELMTIAPHDRMTSRWAVATFTLGSVALFSWVSAGVLYHVFPATPGHDSPATDLAGLALEVLKWVCGLLGPVVLITGVAAFVSVRRSGGTRKGSGLALMGAVMAAVPYLVPVVYLLSR